MASKVSCPKAENKTVIGLLKYVWLSCCVKKVKP